MKTKQKPADKKIDKPVLSQDQAVIIPKEIGGRGGPDPVRYGDWEMNGKCVDF
ncbi:MAG: DUF1674 domain-containing protein [Pseudobdellovibrionaceae bacterium]